MTISQTKKRYGLFSIVIVIKVLQWLLEKILGRILPVSFANYLFDLAVVAALILVGFLIADLNNTNSDIRRWWREHRALFDVGFHPASEVIEKEEIGTPYFSLHFKKAFSNVSIELVLYPHVQLSINSAPILLSKIEPKDYAEGEKIRVSVATIPKATNKYGQWAGGAENSIIRHSAQVIEIRATRKGKVLQSYKVFISYGEYDAATFGRYWFLPEDRRVFEFGSPR